MTGAQYFNASSAEDLRTVYEGLSHRMVTQKKETELTGLAALGAALLMAWLRDCRWPGSGSGPEDERPASRVRDLGILLILAVRSGNALVRALRLQSQRVPRGAQSDSRRWQQRAS